MHIEEVDKYIKSHYLLYKQDIKIIIDKIITAKKIKNRKQLKYVVSFLESLFYLIDYEIMDNKIVNIFNRDIDYIPAPSASRVMLVNSLLDYKLIDFDYITSNNSFEKIKIWTLSTYNKMLETEDGIKKIKSVDYFISGLVEYYNNLLSNLCYLKLHELIYNHIFDFKRDCIKLAYKLHQVKKNDDVEFLFYQILKYTKDEKKLIFCYNAPGKYDFENSTFGSTWEVIYNKLKETLL